jgi:hypothetical protein
MIGCAPGATLRWLSAPEGQRLERQLLSLLRCLHHDRTEQNAGVLLISDTGS